MPIARVNLSIKELLYEQESYEILEDTARHLYKDFDMQKFELAVLGADGYFEIDMKKVIQCSKIRLDGLDKRKAHYALSEKGQHYVNELFYEQPCNWGSRGTPFFWCYLARMFSEDTLPTDIEVFKRKYINLIQNLGVPYGVDEYVYIPQFANGGMSSGMVGGMFATEALDVMVIRIEDYNRGMSK